MFAALTAVVFSGGMGIASAYTYNVGHAAKKAVPTAACACPHCACNECACTDCTKGNCSAGCCK